MSHPKPYPAYKDSGVPWLGDLPEHWQVVPNRATFKELKDSGHPDEQMLSVTITQGVIQQSSLLSDTSKKDSSNEDKSKYKLVHPGDIAYNKMRAWQGALGVSQHRGIVSPAYITVRPGGEQHAKYFHHLLRTPAFAKEAERWSYGISSDQWSLRPEEFRQIYCCVPPFPEQTAIVRYLDYMDRCIRRYINAKKKLIALLNERKQAIIHQAVTHGLDPNVRLKPSGVEWLGDIPEHWEASRIKSLARPGGKTFTDGDWIESPYITSEGVRLIQTGNIGIGVYREKGFRYISPQMCETFGCTLIAPSDVLICRLGDPVARACLAPDLGVTMITSVDVCILKTSKAVNAQFLVYVLSNGSFLEWVASIVRGSTRDRISRSMLGAFTVQMPPNEVQIAIVRFLDSATVDIDAATNNAQREINLIREYRTRLIADVVMGKLDVREVAANLPDEVEEEQDTFGEAEALDDSESVTEDGDELPVGAIDDD